jgi:hypothetical protein
MNDRITRPSLRVPRAAVADRIPVRAHKPRFMLGALECRVFAQVDGRASVHTIARIVGFSPSEVMSVLERLERVNAVRFADAVEIESDELEEEARETLPDLAFERPTLVNPETMGR